MVVIAVTGVLAEWNELAAELVEPVCTAAGMTMDDDEREDDPEEEGSTTTKL